MSTKLEDLPKHSRTVKPELRSVAVFCGSSNGNDPAFAAAAEALGKAIAARGLRLVYGGGSLGLMGIVSRTVHENGGRVLGIIPHSMVEACQPALGEQVVMASMHERKAKMAEEADAFIALPGGLGTLEELLEMATWGQLGIHRKPVVVLNVAGFYDALMQHLDSTVAAGFLGADMRQLILATDSAEQVLDVVHGASPAAGYFDWTREEL
mmetsp:Transcript_43882/g.103215  ORF Transcript_43882/g.103215 Transcript_43882/m.103215 type:complete len:210 (+) Transcript_43882:1-630(+)